MENHAKSVFARAAGYVGMVVTAGLLVASAFTAFMPLTAATAGGLTATFITSAAATGHAEELDRRPDPDPAKEQAEKRLKTLANMPSHPLD